MTSLGGGVGRHPKRDDDGGGVVVKKSKFAMTSLLNSPQSQFSRLKCENGNRFFTFWSINSPFGVF